MPRKPKTIQRCALKLKHCAGGLPVYLFSLTGKELFEVADVSRVSRDELGALIGYQRPEVRRHVRDMVDYLNGDRVVFPNSIILALSPSIRFKELPTSTGTDAFTASGVLTIPLHQNTCQRAAWIVDGQQRALAISKSHRSTFAVPISGFVTDDLELQRDQFLRINNTRPLPRGLLTELLPTVSSALPANLESKRLPSVICELLATRPGSPFLGLVRRSSGSKPSRCGAVVADTSLIKMLSDSISTPTGALFPYCTSRTGDMDLDSAWLTLVTYWNAVQQVFPDAWGKPPAMSRLMHGAGIRAMGRLMDRIMSTIDPKHESAEQHVIHSLELVAPVCRWTAGRWDDLDGMPWNEIQNVPRHIQLLSSVLIRNYVQRRGV